MDKMIYTKQCNMSLGNMYMKHVMALTKESLHAKADIASQLAIRDQVIKELEATMKNVVDNLHSSSLEEGGITMSQCNYFVGLLEKSMKERDLSIYTMDGIEYQK